MFRHLGAILRESTKTKDEGHQYLVWLVGLEFLCLHKLPQDGTLVPQHVVVDTTNRIL